MRPPVTDFASNSPRTAHDPLDELADDFRRIGGWSRVHIVFALTIAALFALWQCIRLKRPNPVGEHRRVHLIGFTPTTDAERG